MAQKCNYFGIAYAVPKCYGFTVLVWVLFLLVGQCSYTVGWASGKTHGL